MKDCLRVVEDADQVFAIGSLNQVRSDTVRLVGRLLGLSSLFDF